MRVLVLRLTLGREGVMLMLMHLGCDDNEIGFVFSDVVSCLLVCFALVFFDMIEFELIYAKTWG
jgi:hypothetical protein